MSPPRGEDGRSAEGAATSPPRDDAGAPQNPYLPPRAPDGGTPAPPPDTLGWIALLAPSFAGAIAWSWGARGAPGALLVVNTLCLIASVVAIALDAKRWRSGSSAKWVVGLVLLFAIAFPLYMHRRARWGAPWRLPHALLSLAIYLGGSLFPMGAADRAKVRVACVPTSARHADGADCVGTQESGSRPTTTCFDVTLSCDDAEVWREHRCVDATPQAPGTAHVLPVFPSGCGHPKLGVKDPVVQSK
ncbi:MAG TPA: hypothetical protein VL400_26760 [Polyangiaceae bacterium]|nr:hypothetical protein [Polyangiaceae bacterium]